ncbi:MAG: sulfatase-like hydrolase/transferase, partial [Planctomycetes bacterium]|nr:sulfatase-like hydrolase/transferase [Planctomycetota bacterium]
VPSPRAEFYGMIANIDENVLRLEKRLQELGLAENTLLIFTTDNGTAAGAGRGGFNAGLRGQKGSEYDGGHRVPFFIHWPAGGLVGGRDISQLTAHIDVLPTLAELCGIELADDLDLDGRSLVSLLLPEMRRAAPAPDRTLVVHSQRIEHPEKWRKSAVMTDRWRLVGGRELFDMTSDPAQENDVAAAHPEVVERLRAEYDKWWAHIDDRFDDYSRLVLGAPEANPTHFTCHDWHADQNQVPWNQASISRDPQANGWWAVDVARGGRYEITLRTRPGHVGEALKAVRARVTIGDVEASADVAEGATAATLEIELQAGPARMQTWLQSANGTSRGAYFVEVRRVEANP